MEPIATQASLSFLRNVSSRVRKVFENEMIEAHRYRRLELGFCPEKMWKERWKTLEERRQWKKFWRETGNMAQIRKTDKSGWNWPWAKQKTKTSLWGKFLSETESQNGQDETLKHNYILTNSTSGIGPLYWGILQQAASNQRSRDIRYDISAHLIHYMLTPFRSITARYTWQRW